ncbi:S8 family peptidase [Arsenicicoccus dermatophilus]|uniref:S8 family peptidase n=1 Tax=Arsenicicoccus dermatophilus TaxID=1076331 RepID=UPI003917114E
MHKHSPTGRGRSVIISTAAMSLVLAPVALAGAPAQAAGEGSTALYIVQVAGNPLSTYTGGVKGIPATKPAKGGKVKVRSANGQAYTRHLVSEHKDALAEIGVPATAKTRDYTTTFNGMAVRLTPAQADKLEKSKSVVRVWKDEQRQADTNTTPQFLGLDGPNGVWRKQFGGNAKSGAGMIVGVIDSGIWPENPSFAPLANPVGQDRVDANWNGVCDGGTGPDKVSCNNKLIGARAYYSAATVPDFEFKNPRGYNAHGTHTAGTAAGNYGVDAVVNGQPVGKISGMAPAARIAVYKALWTKPDNSGASGATVDLVAAIDQAVADGVDVINYSVSGSSTYSVTPDEIAFFNAADAGVFVSASAGNSGDTVGTSSVAHNSPWEMTVAASTAPHAVAKTVTLGNGKVYTGVGTGPKVGPAPVVSAAGAALPGADATKARQCYSDADNDPTNGVTAVLDAAKIKGKILLCERGGNARTDKGDAAKNAGAIGMIQVNTTDAQSTNADFMTVPMAHLDAKQGAEVKAYVASDPNPTATLSDPFRDPNARHPQMAGFSSYGPALAGGGDLLKPDITAPGVDIIAAVSPKEYKGNNFGSMSGTSMSAPHIAGLGALLKQLHPDWSPMAVKSAMMTTASVLDDHSQPIQRGSENATPLDFGAGHVTPPKMVTPGLVYDSAAPDWLKYLCGINQLELISDPGTCAKVGTIDPSDLNYPSIAIGDLAGTQTVTRTVRNVEDKTSVYKVRVQQPTGVAVSVQPNMFTIKPGESKTYKVTFRRTAAQFDQYAFGALTWTGNRGQVVRSPLAIRSVALSATPGEVKGTTTSGSASLLVKPGFSGTLTAKPAGAVPSQVNAGEVAQGKSLSTTVQVPEGAKAVRFATFDADYPAGTDIDLTVLKDGKEVGTSGEATAEEAVTLLKPAAGSYTVEAKYFAGPAASLSLKQHSFVLTDKAEGNLTATPASQAVTSGKPATVKVDWKGLTAGQHYLGAVALGNAGAPVKDVLVTLDPK